MSDSKSDFRKALGTTSILGFVQIAQLFIGLIRAKFAAIYLGILGTGILGLLNSPIGIISNFSGLGLNYSAVKEISEYNANQKVEQLETAMATFRQGLIYTGIFGVLITFLLSPVLSHFSFNNNNYTWHFIILSSVVFINSILNGNRAILQALRDIKGLARSTVEGLVLSSICTIPLYYFYGIRGIVPSLILGAIFSHLATWRCLKKNQDFLKIKRNKFSTVVFITMIKRGFLMIISSFATTGVGYLVILYISNTGGLEQVGLYNAGWNIVGQYSGLIFISMGSDFFPKLSAIAHNIEEVKKAVNSQTELALLLLGPMVISMVFMVEFVIKLLYTTEFLPATNFIIFACGALLFKACSWSLGYILLAKGDTKLVLFSEVVINIILLCLNIAGYSYLGITGIGLTTIIVYIIHLTVLYLIVSIKYQFRFNPIVIKLAFIWIILFTLMTLSKLFIPNYSISIIPQLAIILTGCCYATIELHKRMDLIELFKTLKSKFIKIK